MTGTVYRPVVDAGWGVMTGGLSPVAVRSQYPTPEQAAAILHRATTLRGGRPVTGDSDIAARDLLTDLAAVAGSNGQHWINAVVALTQRWPQAYPALTPDALSRMAAAAGLLSRDVKIGGKNLKGYKITDVKGLIAARD